MSWQDIVVSNKILGHISSGIYRTPAGAIKELISNSFDASATRVAVTTNQPSFDVITCRDNGTGMTPEKFMQMMRGGIGDSSKRVDHQERTSFGRPVIGRLGIGLLGIAQVCHEFTVTSHHKETQTAFKATVKMMDFLREKVEEVDPRENDTEIDVGKFSIEHIEYDSEQAGTYVVASDMRSVFVRRFRDSFSFPLPSRYSAFLEVIHKHRSAKELGDYWQMVWGLTVACPVPYLEEVFDWESVEASKEFKTNFAELKQEIESYSFRVVVDGLTLHKPNVYPNPAKRRNGLPMTGRIFPVNYDLKVYSRPLKLRGYIYLQDGQAVEPIGVRGILVRIRNVAIGDYDTTLFGYPKIEGPRFNWLSGEVYVEEGLENALNIDRDSFQEMNEHFTKFQQTMYEELDRVFSEAGRGVTTRSKLKRKQQQDERQLSFQKVLSEELGGAYEIVEVEKASSPIEIDTKGQKLLIDRKSSDFPRSKSKREIAELAATAYELSLLVSPPERKERFYELLYRFLEL